MGKALSLPAADENTVIPSTSVSVQISDTIQCSFGLINGRFFERANKSVPKLFTLDS